MGGEMDGEVGHRSGGKVGGEVEGKFGGGTIMMSFTHTDTLGPATSPLLIVCAGGVQGVYHFLRGGHRKGAQSAGEVLQGDFQ